MKRKMKDENLEMKPELGTSPSAINTEVEVVNGSRREEAIDIRAVLVVGAGPAGLMLAYV
jgi:NADPH-dependent 2,4-dienoyl-CoA reductase/sulfur reductase-like enzyme